MRGLVVLRRAVLLPVVVLVEAALVLTSPVLLIAATTASMVSRSSRPLRTVALVIAYAAIELTALAQILNGVSDWDRLVARLLDDAYQAMRRILTVPLVLEDGSPTSADLRSSDGVIVLARHCGPGDSVFIARLLAVEYGLSLRIVLKRVLRLEPTIDLAAEHLPLCFVGGRGGGARAGIAELASTLSAGDALLLFPEGRNFSWPRWQAAIEQLKERGQHVLARRAQRRTHTLPPHLGGAFAALSAAPHADVLLLAHSGFSDDGRDRPWWRLPIGKNLVVRTVLIPAAQVPREEEKVRVFLDQAWSQVDTWVEGHVDLLAVGALP
jgi:1-acyl-sn-glycerol-3-phosphate acyltransferase